MSKIEVKSKDYQISDAMENEIVLYTVELNEDIAFTIFCKKLKKAALARNINQQQLKKLFEEMNPDNKTESELFTIRLIGGEANSENSKKYLKSLIEMLNGIDRDTNIVNIISLDTCERFHPNSFEFDCYHGGIRVLETL